MTYQIIRQGNFSITEQAETLTGNQTITLPNATGTIALNELLHAVARTGNYNDLSNKPNIPSSVSTWTASNNTNGYARDSQTGFTVQWGRITAWAGGASTYTFPRRFNSAYAVTVQNITTPTNPYKCFFSGTSLTSTGFSGMNDDTTTTAVYIAVGFS